MSEEFIEIFAYEIGGGDIIESHDDLIHTVEGVMYRESDNENVVINVSRSDHNDYSAEFELDDRIRVKA